LVDIQVPSSSQRRDVRSVMTAVEGFPGVEAVTWGWPIGPPFTERIQPVDALDGTLLSVDVRRVGPRFFDTMRIPLALGRDLTVGDFDRPAQRAAVVNETFARRYLPAVNPIGRLFVRRGDTETGRAAETLQIVGVARDTLARTVGDGFVPVVYLPQPSPALAVRMAAPVPAEIRRLERNVERVVAPGSVVTATSMADAVAAALLPTRIATIVLGALGCVGVVLAMTGLFAVVSRAASRRTFEIGVRIALGATRGGIVRMIVRDALRIVAIGCVIGSTLTFGLARALQAAITSQSLIDPAAFAAVVVLLLVIGVAASVRPALRAAKAEPLAALRSE
jgi:hypothetical protein